MIFLDGIALPSDLIWIDQYQFSAVQRDVQRSLSGSLIIQTCLKKHGRPITLSSGQHGWVAYSVVKQLACLRDVDGGVFDLVLDDSSSFVVMFVGDGLTARPVEDVVSPPDNWPFLITLSLMTVSVSDAASANGFARQSYFLTN